jgi:hypothetical protein
MTSATLPSLPWVPPPITPLPDLFEDNSEFVWHLFDAAVRALDKQLEHHRELQAS